MKKLYIYIFLLIYESIINSFLFPLLSFFFLLYQTLRLNGCLIKEGIISNGLVTSNCFLSGGLYVHGMNTPTDCNLLRVHFVFCSSSE